MREVARVLPSGRPALTLDEREALRALVDAAVRAVYLPEGHAAGGRQRVAMTRGLRPRYKPGKHTVFWGPIQAPRTHRPIYADYL